MPAWTSLCSHSDTRKWAEVWAGHRFSTNDSDYPEGQGTVPAQSQLDIVLPLAPRCWVHPLGTQDGALAGNTPVAGEGQRGRVSGYHAGLTPVREAEGVSGSEPLAAAPLKTS